MSLRDLDIDVDVEVDASELSRANEEADRLVRSMRELERTYHIDLDVDNDTRDELTQIKLMLEELESNPVTIDVDISNATHEFMELEHQIHMLEKTVDIRVDVDTTAAHAQLAGLNSHKKLAGTNSNMGGGLFASLGSMVTPGGFVKMATIFGALIVLLPVVAGLFEVLVGVLGVLGVSIGVVAGGLLALVSAVGVAAVGLGGFAVLGITSIAALYDENAKLTKEQKALKKETDSVITSWKNLTKSLQPQTFGAISSGVATVNTLLDKSKPILENATSSVDKLLGSLNKSLDGQNMQSFFSYLERSVGPLTTNIGNGLGYMLQGVFNTMVALEPLTNWVAQGFENMMSRFSDWTASLSDSPRMQAFMQYVQDNLPTIGSIFGDMRNGIVDFFAAFDDTAVDGLGWMANKMQDFAKWARDLDNNENFQEFLTQLREDGPIIAEILGNMAENVTKLIMALADSGTLDLIAKLTDPELFNFEGIADNFSLKSLFGPSFIHVLDDFDLNGIFSGVKENILSKIEPIDWARFIPGINWLTIIGVFVWERFISKFEWPTIPFFEWLNFIKNFEWPKLPSFSWREFINQFKWPTLPSFSWSNFISKFKWPDIDAGTIMSKVGIPGFSTGLGRVDNDMAAIVHKNEAILPAHQAETLREMGVISGDGRYPTLNTEPLVASTTMTTSTSHSGGTRIDVGGVNIVVQGGNTNNETAQSLRDELENFFAELNIIMPVTREG